LVCARASLHAHCACFHHMFQHAINATTTNESRRVRMLRLRVFSQWPVAVTRRKRNGVARRAAKPQWPRLNALEWEPSVCQSCMSSLQLQEPSQQPFDLRCSHSPQPDGHVHSHAERGIARLEPIHELLLPLFRRHLYLHVTVSTQHSVCVCAGVCRCVHCRVNDRSRLLCALYFT
jgi:hypothetical protein